jgi:arsenate reductase (glutaredoxin)
VNIQIYGRNKCFDTRKAERYFKERGIKFQRIDLDRFGLSRKELESVSAATGLSQLLDTQCPAFGRLNLDMIHSQQMKQELMLNNPVLYLSPIVRNGKQATVGYKPEIWKDWE